MSARVALTVAGVDPTGGAGIAADLATFRSHGLWGMAVVTALTAQNHLGGRTLEVVSADTFRAQITAVFEQTTVAATKTGMLASAQLVEAVAEAQLPRLVVDPLVRATSGFDLADDGAALAMRALLVPKALVVTPNASEAGFLAGFDVADRASAAAAALEIVAAGPQAVLVTGGHIDVDNDTVADCLAVAGAPGVQWLEAPRLDVEHTHGSGCVLSAAVCAALAHGMDPQDACIAGVAYAHRAIADAVRFEAGGGAVNPPSEA